MHQFSSEFIDVIVKWFKENWELAEYNELKGELSGRCRFCGDGSTDWKRRFNYNPVKDKFNCFNCGQAAQTNATRILLNTYGATKERYLFMKYMNKHHTQKVVILDANNERQEVDQNEIYNKFYKCVVGKKELTTKLNDKIKQFKFYRNIPDKYPIFMGKGDYFGRYVIPVYGYGGNLVYWTGRSFAPRVKPKYLNFNVDTEALFPFLNIAKFDQKIPIVCMEGLIDGIASRNNNITSGNGIISLSKIRQLLNLTKIGIIVAYDWDKPGINNLVQTYEACKSNGLLKKVKFFFGPIGNGKDFSDLYKNGTLSYHDAFEYVLENSEKTQLKTELRIKKFI